MSTRFLVTALSLGLSAGVASAQTATAPEKGQQPAAQPGNQGKKPETKVLKAGAEAPKLSVETWVKGSEVSGFDSGKVYVVEFWATWCPPCVKAIPHLTELAKEHKDVTFIGVAGFERGKSPEANLEKVKKFVADKGDKMDYTVAFDSDGTMGKDWMDAAKQDGIPTAFIVGADQKIAWIGSPFEIEKPLEKAIKKAGKHDAKPDDKADKPADPKPEAPAAPAEPKKK